jgi:signal transduction histidine kinase
MNAEFSCPNCGQAIQPQMRICEHCRVNLAMAVVLAEQEALLPIQPASGVPMAPEVLVPRIGEYLIERKVIQPADLRRALTYQKERASNGDPILLGQAMLELGLVSRETLDQVVTIQILELQTALSDANRALKQRIQERTQELQRAIERLSELNILKANFVANISHELRTPLTHIKGYLDLFAEGGLGPVSQSQEDALRVMMRSEEKLEQLIEDLIQFSLSARNKLKLELEKVDLKKLILNSVDRLLPKAQERQITIHTTLDPGLPAVWADEDKIGWVMHQLLDNAVKFTPNGGAIFIQANISQGDIIIAVIDTGIGIPEDRISEIFDPFHQLDSSMTRQYSGTGLGLSMVQRIIEAHGSQVRVESTVGRGSRFEFTLPTLHQAIQEMAARQSNLKGRVAGYG